MSDNKIRDVSDKFKKAQEKKEKTIIDKLAEEEKNKKLNELLFDIENLYALLVIGEASDVDIMFNNRIETLNVNEIPTTTKLAKGKKLVGCKKGEQIIAMI